MVLQERSPGTYAIAMYRSAANVRADQRAATDANTENEPRIGASG